MWNEREGIDVSYCVVSAEVVAKIVDELEATPNDELASVLLLNDSVLTWKQHKEQMELFDYSMTKIYFT